MQNYNFLQKQLHRLVLGNQFLIEISKKQKFDFNTLIIQLSTMGYQSE